MTDHVVLLHGIWMRPFTLALLARRLRAQGFTVSRFGYDSVAGSPATWAPAVAAHMEGLSAQRVHLLGHSLGGLLALMLARDGHARGGGRVVCLGTPLCGSAVAREFARHRTLHWLLGHVDGLLCKGTACWPDGTAVGMVAGGMPFGFGAFVPGLARPHDGMVAVAETRDPRLAGHVTVHASHSGLLLSRAAADHAAAFLARGAFADPAGTGKTT
jgi:pimeloyl-ACP methyl ester carboxylesterase